MAQENVNSVWPKTNCKKKNCFLKVHLNDIIHMYCKNNTTLYKKSEKYDKKIFFRCFTT